MSIKKRAAALICSFMLAMSLASCADTSYICKTDDVSINAGVYIYYVISQISTQEYTYYYANGAMSDDIINEAYGDDGALTVGDYAQTYAYDTCRKLAAVQMKFDELGLELTADDKKAISEAVEASWDADYYESIGIAKSSIEQIQTSTTMLEKIFLAYYDKDGIEEVTDSEIEKHISDNYVRFKLISLPKEDDSGDKAKLKAKELEELAKTKSFDEVMAEYEASEEKENESQESSDKDRDYNVMINKNSSSYSSNDIIGFIDKSMSVNEIKTYEDDYYWYVIQKLDALDYSKYVEENRRSLLEELRNETYEDEITSWIDEYNIEVNDDAYSKYTAKSVYGKYKKYQDKDK